MRIAFFVAGFPVLSETFILNQITGLVDRGHDIAVFAERRPGQGPVHQEVREYRLLDRTVYLEDAQRTRPGLSDLTAALGLAVHAPRTLPSLRRAPAAPFGGRLPLLRRFAALRATGFEPDIVHGHFGYVAQQSRFASALWPVPFVASFYGADCSRAQFRRDGYYDPLFQHADRITVLSGAMEGRLRSLGCPPDLLRQQHIGIDPERFPFRARGVDRDESPARLLTVARLVEKKGVEFALRAIAQLVEGDAAVRYDIVGDGPLRQTLEALAGSLGISSLVTFHGDLDLAAVREAMANADLFLLPSVTAADGDEEGTPTVLMEASAAGLPVVSTVHAGIPEVVPDGVSGILVPERDVDALADALATLLAQPDRWAEMGRTGRAHISAFYDLRKLATQLEELYLELVSGDERRDQDADTGPPRARAATPMWRRHHTTRPRVSRNR